MQYYFIYLWMLPWSSSSPFLHSILVFEGDSLFLWIAHVSRLFKIQIKLIKQLILYMEIQFELIA